jgi:hypothetical protein
MGMLVEGRRRKRKKVGGLRCANAQRKCRRTEVVTPTAFPSEEEEPRLVFTKVEPEADFAEAVEEFAGINGGSITALRLGIRDWGLDWRLDGEATTHRSASAMSFVFRWCTSFMRWFGKEALMRSATSVGGPPSQYVPNTSQNVRQRLLRCACVCVVRSFTYLRIIGECLLWWTLCTSSFFGRW